VFYAAHLTDDPEGSCLSVQLFRNFLESGWLADPGEVWIARDQGEHATVAGWYRLALPDMENTDRARLILVVAPEQRRHGLGRVLLRHAADRAAERGRSVLTGPARGDTAGTAFARAMGAKPGITDVRRVLRPRALPPGRLAELRASAERAAAGYSLLSWTGPVPGELLGPVADLYNALEDAPNTAGQQQATWTADRIRERADGVLHRTGIRRYSVAARHDATGDLAALTQLDIDPGRAGCAHQGLTAVIRPHRGHRLGLLVKTAATQRFMVAEPHVELIETWNADSNAHMIAINDVLGYQVRGRPNTRWVLELSGLVATSGLLGHRHDAEHLSLRHAQVQADGLSGTALAVGQRAVRHADPDHVGQVPLPGLDRELGADLMQRHP